jgi:tripartite-type tricarboxylate transporter receptor subunit TctC
MVKKLSIKTGFLMGLGLLAAMQSAPALAQTDDYPSKPITIVIGYPPGGGADTVARVIQQSASNILGKRILVENRPGASGRAGTDHVARAKPDGHTLLISPEGPIVIGPHISQTILYDAMKDLKAVSLLTRTSTMLVATRSLPVESVKELLDRARAKPGGLFFGSSGVGGPNHLAGEVFKQLTGANIVHVPYPGTGAVIPAVLSGEVDMMFGFVPGLDPLVKSNQVRALAVGSSNRVASLPDVPTMAEAGVQGYDMASWIGLFAPGATPGPIARKLSESMAKAMNEPDVKARLMGMGFDIVGSSPEDFAKFVKTEDEKYIPLLKKLDIKE